SWAASAVIIGRFQSVRNEVDEDEAAARGVTIVRRMSGGGAMFVQPDATITYSIYLPEQHVEGLSFAESYAACDSWVIAILRDLGVEAWYAGFRDRFGLADGTLSPDERAAATALVSDQYATDRWTHDLP